MPLIIAATDFSAVADNAVNYACDLATTRGADVLVTHSYVFPVMFSDLPLPASLITEAQTDAEDHMRRLTAQLQAAYPQIKIKGQVDYGDIINTLSDYGKENKTPWLIVIGNSVAGEKATWPENTLVDALKKLKYPVLAVPPAATYQPVKNICFAFDNRHKDNDNALTQLTAIVSGLGASLHVLHAQPDPANSGGAVEIDGRAKELLGAVDTVYHVVHETNIDDSIQEFISGSNIDWLVLLPRKHSFFEGLFHKSHTKAIAHHAQIPILALHETPADA
ncbi:MAG: universal stress protein [Bacteroidota bacterium]